jgi:prolyl oligopeptidase
VPKLMEPAPHTPAEPVTEILHGLPVTDSYRWLEDQESSRTRAWIAAQTQFARSYLDALPSRARIRERIRELLDVETYDSIFKVGKRYFFRKRVPGQEQPCIYVREGIDGPDQLLVDPSDRGTGKFTAVKPLRPSPDGRLLLYEVKQGGERAGTFEIIDVNSRRVLPDRLPHGYLRGFAFAPDSSSFYYVHEDVSSTTSARVALQHILGTSSDRDKQVLAIDGHEKPRLVIVPGMTRLGLLVFRFLDKTYTDFYVWSFLGESSPEPVIRNADYKFDPTLVSNGRILAISDFNAPNFRIVEIQLPAGQKAEFKDVIPESDSMIQGWLVTKNRIFVSYVRQLRTEIHIFDHFGKWLEELASNDYQTIRMVAASEDDDELIFERESFANPIQTCSYRDKNRPIHVLASRSFPSAGSDFGHTTVWFPSNDATPVPMFLVGRPDVLQRGSHPTIMTAYGGYAVPMTPQFSAFVAFLMEHGCLFALPNIRGGSEFGVDWHNAAKRRQRQVAFDDFLAAAQWLIDSGRTQPEGLAIFGGSNSGLLVGAAMTQRPDLFHAVLCLAPLLDMLRYHLFDTAHVWKEEFGTADNPADFAALFRYSPYHRVSDFTAYPATMLVSGDCDQNCNALHARKMAARLQAANISDNPIVLDYNRYRGHSPVLPMSARIDALTDRLAFVCDQLRLNI